MLGQAEYNYHARTRTVSAASARRRAQRPARAPDRGRRPRRAGPPPARRGDLRPVPRPAHLRRRPLHGDIDPRSAASASGTGIRTSASRWAPSRTASGPWKGQVRLRRDLPAGAHRDADPAELRGGRRRAAAAALRRRAVDGRRAARSSSSSPTSTPYSYLFCQPTFRTPEPERLADREHPDRRERRARAERAGLPTIDTVASGSKQELSRQCAVIPKGANGPAGDQFTLVFEHLGGYQNVVVEDAVPPAPIPLDPEPRGRSTASATSRASTPRSRR